MSGTYIVRRGRRFAVVVYMGKDPANRARNRRKWYGGFSTHREAEMFQATLAHHPAFSAGMGIYGNSRLRTSDYLDTWLAQHAKNGKIEEKTEERYKQFVRIHITPALGHVPLVRLSPQTIQEAYGSWISKGLSHTTVRHIANLLHLALETAVRRGLIVRNPVDQTDPPSRNERPVSILSLRQLTQYLDDAKETAPVYLWALYVTKAMTGMRFGELCGLRESDLNLEACTVSLEQSLKRPGPHATFGKLKTDRSRRTITLSVEVVEALRLVRKWKLAQKLRRGPRFREYGLVFCGPSGKPLHQNNIRYRDHYPRLERLKLPRIRPHDLRHGHATHLVAAGIDHRTVADRLGHSSPSFTLKTYVHGVSETQRRAAEVASTLLALSRGATVAQ